LTPTDAVILA